MTQHPADEELHQRLPLRNAQAVEAFVAVADKALLPQSRRAIVALHALCERAGQFNEDGNKVPREKA